MVRAWLISGLLVLISACAPAAFGQATSGQGLHRLSLLGRNWSLDVSVAPLAFKFEEPLQDDTGYDFVYTAEPGNQVFDRIIILTIRLEAAKVKGSDAELRDSTVNTLKKSKGVNSDSVKTFEYKQIPTLRYTRANSMTGNSRVLEAFFVREDVWITFRLAAVSLKKDDEQWFNNVLDSVKFRDTSTAAVSFDYYYKAITLVRQRRYEEAFKNFNIALGLERTQRQLDIEHWRNLLVYLIDLNVARLDRANAKELLDYGLANDPSFPLFHLALAHHYASQGDMDKTIAALEQAYAYRKNDRRTAGWNWIDPLSDPEFESFKKNEKFRKAVKALKK